MRKSRFPPWTLSRAPGGWQVADADGGVVAYFYGHEEDFAGTGPLKLTADQARRLAANFAKLPELLKRPEPPTPLTNGMPDWLAREVKRRVQRMRN